MRACLGRTASSATWTLTFRHGAESATEVHLDACRLGCDDGAELGDLAEPTGDGWRRRGRDPDGLPRGSDHRAAVGLVFRHPRASRRRTGRFRLSVYRLNARRTTWLVHRCLARHDLHDRCGNRRRGSQRACVGLSGSKEHVHADMVHGADSRRGDRRGRIDCSRPPAIPHADHARVRTHYSFADHPCVALHAVRARDERWTTGPAAHIRRTLTRRNHTHGARSGRCDRILVLRGL